MKLIVYFAFGDNDAEVSLLHAAEKAIPLENVELYRSVESVRDRLRPPNLEALVALFVPSGKADLEELVSLADFLNGIPVLIILSDRDPKSIAIAHRLRPRFVTFAGDDLAEVLSVINKMGKARSPR
mgnify:CR=1 FL=1